MTKTQNDPGLRTSPRFARCPRCQELIDAESVTCRFCGNPVTAEELYRSADLQEKLIQAKAKANDRSSMVAAIKALVVTVLVFTMWFPARFLSVR
jgi:hypothetical protein